MSQAKANQRAVFLDRDGVVIRDQGFVESSAQLELFPDAPAALARLAGAGFRLIVVTNQAVVARGLISETELDGIHADLRAQLLQANGPKLDALYYCPHHPNADLVEFRRDCDCRKPRPGMLTRAAEEWRIELAQSFLIGDRVTDILAGKNAGCRTILLETGRHADAPIQTSDPINAETQADARFASLTEATKWILGQA